MLSIKITNPPNGQHLSRRFSIQLYLRSKVSRNPQRELCSCRVLSEIQQTRRVSVVQCRGLSIITDWWVTIVYWRLPVISEWRMAEVRFDILSGFYL